MNIFSIEVKLYSGRDSLVYHEPIKFEYDGRSRDVYKYLEKALDEIEQYRALGTVEELRIAKEKQIPKKLASVMRIDNTKYVKCPTCKLRTVLYDGCSMEYCKNCGQHISNDGSDTN